MFEEIPRVIITFSPVNCCYFSILGCFIQDTKPVIIQVLHKQSSWYTLKKLLMQVKGKKNKNIILPPFGIAYKPTKSIDESFLLPLFIIFLTGNIHFASLLQALVLFIFSRKVLKLNGINSHIHVCICIYLENGDETFWLELCMPEGRKFIPASLILSLYRFTSLQLQKKALACVTRYPVCTYKLFFRIIVGNMYNPHKEGIQS